MKPKQWYFLNIIPVSKKGYISLYSNCSGISLLIANTINRMIMNIISLHLDGHLRKNQYGFRSGRTITSQLLVLR